MDFMENWFRDLWEGIDRLDRGERGKLFSCCAASCAKDALKYLYSGLCNECGGDPDLFFDSLDKVPNVDGRVVAKGKEYEIHFLECNCPVKTEAGITSPCLCECSRQSIMCELKELFPGLEFTVEEKATILKGDRFCCFGITLKQ